MSKSPASKLDTNQTSDTVKEYADLFTRGFEALEPIRSTWKDKEMVLLSRNPDLGSQTTKSQVNDGRLSTIILERAARVMAQLPSGATHALTEKNAGMGKLMGLVMDRYVMPNAINPQDHLTKLRMLDMYSMVYGSMPILYDWQVTDSYIGPNSWIQSPYNVVYEPGKFTIPESNYVGIRSEVTVKWLKAQRQDDDGKGWSRGSVKYVLDKVEECGGKAPGDKSEYRSFIERNRLPSSTASKGDNAIIEIVTFYESGSDGHWVTLCPDFDWVKLRDIPNPHKNGKIPLLLKHCFPLLDSMIGLGDIERGMTLQKSMNSLINMYMDGVLQSIFPPIKVITDQVDDPQSLIWAPGQKWKLKNQGAVEMLGVNPGGLQTFQSTYGFLISALLNQNGTTDTARTTEQDPGFGRTPQALAMQANRESARDAWDRSQMEATTEELFNNYIDLIARKQTKSIPLYLFKPDIASLRSQYKEDDFLARFGEDRNSAIPLSEDGMGGTVKVSREMLKGGKENQDKDIQYKFFIDTGSTQKREQAEESQNLDTVLMTLLKAGPQNFPNVNLPVLVEKWIKSKGIEGADEIVKSQDEMASQPAPQVDPATGQPIPQGPTMTPDGMPAIAGATVPNTAGGAPQPTMQGLGMTAQDPDVMNAIHSMRGLQ